MAGNLVEITVSAVNETEEGFAGAKAGAAEAGDAADDYAASADKAADASRGEAGAMDETAAAAGRSADAQREAATAADETAASSRKSADAQDDSAAKTDLASDAAGKGGKALRDLALGAGIAAAGALYMGVKFQEGATQLVTGAGQSAKGLKQVETGMLAVSTQTATSSKDVEAGMYMIESAGFHGAAGLTVLKAAAEGAKVGNAQLGDVANVVTSALNAYHLPASKAVAITNQLVATVASGKMHMQDLATSISNVLPVAASAHISFAQVGGALATMTAQGMTARRASMNLANMIRSLISPSSTASAEMKNLGLNANDVSKNVGKAGLTGTLDTLTEAILKNSKGGQALAGTFAGMDPATKGYARGILAGKVTTNDLTDAMKNMTPQQAALITNFAKTASGATGLKTTFDGAMKTMVGGATGLNVALLLGGKHMGAFKDNVDSVGAAARHGGADVEHWGDITKDTAFKLDQAKVSAENLGTSVGMALLPAMDKILGPLDSFVSWIGKSKIAVDILAGAIVTALAGFAVVKGVEAFQKLQSTWSALSSGAVKLATKMGLIGAAEDEEAVSTEAATDAQEGLNLAMLANPITLIIAAIALLVIAFVELWKHSAAFRDFWKDAWKVIEKAAVDAWHFIDDDMIHPLMSGIDDLVGFIRSHWQLLATILATVLLGPVGGLIVFIATHWAQFRALTSELVDDVAGFFRTLPGRIMGALAALPGMLFSAGAHIMEMLANGIRSAIGVVGDAVHDAVSVVHDFLPFSPAKKGPLSGSGSPDQAGKRIAQMLGQGMISGLPAVSAAASRMAGSAGIGGHPMAGAGGYGGGVVIQVTGGGGALDELFITWLKQRIRVKGGGGTNSVQRALGQRWPAGG